MTLVAKLERRLAKARKDQTAARLMLAEADGYVAGLVEAIGLVDPAKRPAPMFGQTTRSPGGVGLL